MRLPAVCALGGLLAARKFVLVHRAVRPAQRAASPVRVESLHPGSLRGGSGACRSTCSRATQATSTGRRRCGGGFEGARAAGVNLAFMGADTGYWHMRNEDGRRTIGEYRTADRDPERDPALKTIQLRGLASPRPECTLMGVQWGELGNADYSPVGAAITPTDPWFVGTGFRADDVLPGLVGYEYDTIFDSCPTPPLTRLFGSNLTNHVRPSAVRYMLQRFMLNALADLTR